MGDLILLSEFLFYNSLKFSYEEKSDLSFEILNEILMN